MLHVLTKRGCAATRDQNQVLGLMAALLAFHSVFLYSREHQETCERAAC